MGFSILGMTVSPRVSASLSAMAVLLPPLATSLRQLL